MIELFILLGCITILVICLVISSTEHGYRLRELEYNKINKSDYQDRISVYEDGFRQIENRLRALEAQPEAKAQEEKKRHRRKAKRATPRLDQIDE